MTISLTHIALHVQDLDASVAFYQSYGGMHLVHQRASHGKQVVWLGHPGREAEFILVILPGGPGREQLPTDFSHLGFALDSREAVDAIAERARSEGKLEWEPKQEPFPVGYYCGIRDPDGHFIEFSYGQPLGPGASLLDGLAEAT